MFLRCIAILSLFISTGLVAQNNNSSTSTTMGSTDTTTGSTNAETTGKTTCSSAGDTRTIEIFYETPGSKIPCRVDYTKASGTQTLWTAKNLEGYCEEKATALAEKLQAAGFDCK